MAQRFYGEFRDDQGDEWRVNIYDDEYTGAISQVTLSAEGFVISYEGNQSDPFQRIIPSKVTFGAYLKSSASFETWVEDAIVQRAEAQVKVAIYKDPDGDNTLWWAGVVLVDQITIPDEFDAFVEFTASDGIALLSRDTEERSLSPLNEHLAVLIAKNPISEFWTAGTGFLRYVNDYEPVGYTGTDYLDDAQVRPPLNHSDLSFTGDPQEFNTYLKLEGLLSAFNMRLFQAEGYWWALPLSYYEQIKDGSNPSTIYRQVDKTGATVTLTFFEANYLNNNKILEDGVDITRMAGGQTMHLNAKKSTRITRRSANQQFLHRDIQSGATLFSQATFHISSSNGLSYSEDTAFLIEASNVWSRSPDPDIAGDAALVTLKLRTTLRAGAYYYNGTAWTTTNSTFDIDIFDFLRDSGQIELSETWNYTTPPIGNDADELTFQGTWKFINGVGTDVTADMTNGYLGWNVVLKIAGQTNVLDFTYQAETTEENFDDVTLADTMFGSFAPLSAFANLNGSISYSGSIPENYQGYLWTGGAGAGEPLLTRVTDDALRLVQFPLKVRTNSYLHFVPLMWQVIKQGTTYWAPLKISTVMNTRRSSVERFILQFDESNITGDNGPDGGFDDISPTGFTDQEVVTSVNGESPDSGGAVVIDASHVEYAGGATVKGQIADNVTDITAVKSVVNIGATTVDFWDGNNGLRVDTTAADVSLQIAKTDVMVVTGSTITNKQATTIESTLKSGALTAETGVGVTNILAKNSSTKAVIALQDGGSTDANQVAIASSGDSLVLQSGGATAVTIDDSQQVGIGTVTPSATLDVVGDVEVTGDVDITGRIELRDSDGNIIVGVTNYTSIAGNNVVIGQGAADSTTYQYRTVVIGYAAYNNATATHKNVVIGHQAGQNMADQDNVVIGERAMASRTNARGVVVIGANTASSSDAVNDLDNSVIIGNAAFGYTVGEFSNSIAIGASAGRNASGSGNVFIGHRAGYHSSATSVSNRLIIENSNDTTTPLIYGEFDNDIVKINGSLEVTDAAEGIILQDTNGVRYNVTVNTSGALVVTSI